MWDIEYSHSMAIYRLRDERIGGSGEREEKNQEWKEVFYFHW
jgi:hypothetical protein